MVLKHIAPAKVTVVVEDGTFLDSEDLKVFLYGEEPVAEEGEVAGQAEGDETSEEEAPSAGLIADLKAQGVTKICMRHDHNRGLVIEGYAYPSVKCLQHTEVESTGEEDNTDGDEEHKDDVPPVPPADGEQTGNVPPADNANA